MSRELVPGRHWLVVLACLVVAFLPARTRDRLRGMLLDLTSRARTSAPLAPTEGPRTEAERALANRIALLEAERASLLRDLANVGAERDVAGASDGVRSIPAEAFPLAGAQDAVRRLVLGRGERDGVRSGAPVLEGSALVGLVGLVTQGRSEVRLVTDPTFRLRATDERAQRDGLLYGTGGPLLVFVPAPSLVSDPEKEPRIGDVILVSRASTLCGLPAVLGTVREVERAPGEGFVSAKVAPATDLARLDRVIVIRQDETSIPLLDTAAVPLAERRR